MKEIKVLRSGNTLYHETLDNGLQIFMMPNNNVNTTYASFNTKYGSIHTDFIPIGEKELKSFPKGIAHFLEHKMFEQEDGIDPMLFYAQNGSDVNAYTSLYNTAYHFSGTTSFKENLKFLLDFVQKPYFTDENVLKEKGIIEEEIKMYQDDPYSELDELIRFNTFNIHPIKYSIAGSIEDIRSITKEHLYACYNTFYHPSNMFLVITGNFDVNDTIDLIKNNQASKTFPKKNIITIKKYNELNTVSKEIDEKIMNVEINKLSYGLKIPIKNIKIKPKYRDIYLSIIFNILFGSTSIFNEEMKEKGYLLSYIMIDHLHTEDYVFISLNADTNYPNELKNAIENTLSNINIDEDDFLRKLKLYISNDIFTDDNVESINRKIVNDLILYDEYYPDIYNIINNLYFADLKELLSKIELNNKTILIIKPNQEV